MKKKATKEQLAFFDGGAKAESMMTAALSPEAERLLANFEMLGEAPDGVKRLRELILELAARGQLVGQDPGDESADILLKRIVGARQVRAGSPIELHDPTGQLLSLPKNWKWAALDALLVHLRNGIATAPSGTAGTAILRISALRPNHVNIDDVRYLPGALSDYEDLVLQQGDLLFTRYTGNAHYVGICGVVPEMPGPIVYPDKLIRGVVSSGHLDARFVALAINTGESRRYIDACARTTAGQFGISGKQLRNTPIPVPPLAEQHRIVAQVDRLMALCDEMEARQAKRRVVAGRLNKAALGELTTAEGPEEFAASLQRVVANFEALVEAPEAVIHLRKLILDLAMRGKLVTQMASDGQSSDHLRAIELEGSRLGQPSLAPRTPIVGPYEVPPTWSWVPIQALFYALSTSGKKVLTSSIGETGRFPVVDQGQAFISGYVDGEDTLINVPGPVIVFGDHTRELKYVDFDFVAGADGIKILRPFLTNERYFYWCLRSFRLPSRGYARHYKVLMEQAFPLPPVAEQARIVAKVDHLMALCDSLEAKIRAADEGARRLAGSLVAELIA